jgi:hypothetical protein
VIDSTYPCLEHDHAFVKGEVLILRPELLAYVKTITEGLEYRDSQLEFTDQKIGDERSDKTIWASPLEFRARWKGYTDHRGDDVTWESGHDRGKVVQMISPHDYMDELDRPHINELIPRPGGRGSASWPSSSRATAAAPPRAVPARAAVPEALTDRAAPHIRRLRKQLADSSESDDDA